MGLPKHLFIALAVLATLKAVVMPDYACVVMATLWLSAQFIIHFYGTDTATARMTAQIDAIKQDTDNKYEALAKEHAELKSRVDAAALGKAFNRGSQ